MWKTFTRLALASSVGLAAVSGGAAANAQVRPPNEEAARIAFTEGLHLRDAEHKPEQALEKFKSAYKLAATPRTAYELGRTYMLLGDWLAAQPLFAEVGRMPPDPLQTPAGKAAREDSSRLERELEERMPAITFELVGAPTAHTPDVAVDGVAVPPEALSLPWKVNPGAHTVTVRVAGEGSRARWITTSDGKTERVKIQLGPPGASALTWSPSPAPDDPRSGPTKALAFAFGGAGVALVGTGAALALWAKSTYDGAKQSECGSAIGAPTDEQCTIQGISDRRAAASRADVASVLFGVGIAAVSAGVVLWIDAPSSKDVRVGVAANGIVVGGGF